MYGHIHLCIRQYVIEEFGQEPWQLVLDQSGCEQYKDFIMFSSYPDDVTLALVTAVVQVCDIGLEDMLEGLGHLFLKFCCKSGYDKMIHTLGDNFVSFIQNLDPLHETLSMTYKELQAPSFRCEMLSDNKLELHYYSYRENLYPLAIGILKSAAHELFHTDITMIVKSRNKIGQDDDVKTKKEHVIFEVTVHENLSLQSKRTSLPGQPVKQRVKQKQEQQISPLTCTKFQDIFALEDFSFLLPYHVMFNKDLLVLSYGEKIRELACLGDSVVPRRYKMCDLVKLVYPYIQFNYEDVLHFINSKYILQLNTPTDVDRGLCLKGQMIHMKCTGNLIFNGSPLLKNLDDMQDKHIYLSDIPMFDASRELILMSQQRITELEISKQLDETTNELKKMADALAVEKKKTDELLYQMLPVKVANLLRDGCHVEAEKFSDTTVLFGDIVSFTVMASIVPPIQIVRMLNVLYSIFDELTSKHSVYKVETIGDAYMVVGGVPEGTKDHAQRVAEFALEMVMNGGRVSSPASGSPIQMRIGIHSGSVVAGVVGHKMPRYCLFGDTVNTASRMESHGQPDKIHCSEATYSLIKHTKRFTFKPRGEVEIKGKGFMKTFFLLSSSNTKEQCDNKDYTDTAGGAGQFEHRNSECNQIKSVNMTTICAIL